MKKTLCCLAGLGLVLGLIVHIISLLGIYIGDKTLFILILHIGIFIVWIPAILELKKNSEFQQPEFMTNINPKKLFGAIFKDTPKPVLYISIGFFIYATINFILFIQASGGGVPDFLDGKYVLNNRGSIIRELTESEYYRMKANELRGLSGHWMSFYGFAMGILWPKKINEK